jgi:ABC-2 type transport system ATP-binding protein
MIDVKNLHKRFGTIVAVDGVSFRIARGESFGLLGPNGAGKSTTLNMIIGIIQPDQGAIQINGRLDPRSIETRRVVGVAPQALALYDELTAVENLRFLGKLYGYSGTKLKARVDWALEFSELTDRCKSRVETYSGGMKRRLNMACALIHEPQVLLLDEPTVGVDPQSRNHIFDRIEQLKAEGRTIIYTTHYMEEAERLCDRVAIMDHGKLLDLGTVDEMVERHGGMSTVECQLTAAPENVTLPGTVDDGVLQFSSDNPIGEISRLTSEGVQFASLKLTQPGLEGVFLALTGRTLRDG